MEKIDKHPGEVFESTHCEVITYFNRVEEPGEKPEANKNKFLPKPIKAYLNVLAFRINSALKREIIKNYPIFATIEPTNFCNLHCLGCPTGLRLDLRKPTAINWELYKEIIDEIGDYLFDLYMYNWGEPLLHSQTPEFIKYAKSKGIRVLLSTNLNANLTDEYIECLIKSGLDEMIVSLDGVTEDTYKKYRRGGNFAVVRKNMLRIHAAKKRFDMKTPIINWQFLVFRHNEHEIETAKEKYKEWGADCLTIYGAFIPSKSYGEYFAPSTIPEYNTYHPDHFYNTETRKQLASNRTCSWLYGAFVLNPDGSVSPCCLTHSESDEFGNYLFSKSFFNVWNNSKFRMARRLLPRLNNLKDQTLRELRVREITGMLNGMIAPHIRNNEIACQRCLMPWLQNIAYIKVNEVSASYMKIFKETKNLHYLLGWILMGVPNSRIVMILRQKISKFFHIINTLSDMGKG